jgi:hypothetical protein
VSESYSSEASCERSRLCRKRQRHGRGGMGPAKAWEPETTAVHREKTTRPEHGVCTLKIQGGHFLYE